MGNQGVRVVVACGGINLALGVLYSWHVVKVALLEEMIQGGSLAGLNDLYSVTCLAYAFSMVFAGRLQDDIGPRATVFLGGALVGLGFLLVATTNLYSAWLAGFGLIGGVGTGFVYAATIPTALRWFSRTRSGLVSGVVVAGYGLAPLHITPLATWLMTTHGAQNAMLILGTGFVVVVALLSQLLAVPSVRPTLFGPAAEDDPGISRLLRSSTTWLLWVTFFVGAGTGLMAGVFLGDLVKSALGEAAFAAVAVVAFGGTAGRVVIGAISDRYGRPRTLTAMLAAQAVLMLMAALAAAGEPPHAAVVLALIGLIAFNYGGNLSLFPAFTRDRFGMRNFGQNYGVIFTAWGVGGFVLSRIAATLHASTQSHVPAGLLACALLLVGCALSRRLQERPQPASTRRQPTTDELPVA